MLYDITSINGAYKFLSEYLEVDRDYIDLYIRRNPSKYKFKKFIEEIEFIKKIKFNNLKLEDIDIILIHITTNDDDCNSIKKYGLINLIQAITLETPLSKYLKSFNIVFDVYNYLIFIDEQVFSIRDYKESKEVIRLLYLKLYDDYNINAFFYVRDFKSYGGRVHEKPEILCNLSKAFNNKNISEKWKNNIHNKCYSVKFKVRLEELEWYTFYDNIEEYKKDYTKKDLIRNELVENALSVIHEDYFKKDSKSELIAYLK
ncbi:hypothetical protein [Clostridioides difficile]|nr:hypothetical protein [Clostridioides difficile]